MLNTDYWFIALRLFNSHKVVSRPRPRPRLSKFSLETSRDQVSRTPSLDLKLTKFPVFWAFAPDPSGEAYSAPLDLLADGKGAHCPWWGGGSLLQMSPSAVLHSSPTRPTIINMNFLSRGMYLQDIIKRKNKQQCVTVRLDCKLNIFHNIDN